MASKIRACHHCGSADLHPTQISEGGLAGVSGPEWTCGRCEYSGPGMEFEEEAARAAFERALSEG